MWSLGSRGGLGLVETRCRLHEESVRLLRAEKGRVGAPLRSLPPSLLNTSASPSNSCDQYCSSIFYLVLRLHDLRHTFLTFAFLLSIARPFQSRTTMIGSGYADPVVYNITFYGVLSLSVL